MGKLYAREARVLQLLVEGWSYEAIARMFNVSVGKIKQIERIALTKMPQVTTRL